MPHSQIQFVDSHTAGEPTRVVVSGAPDLGAGTLAERAQLFASHHDSFRSAVVNEPRGSDVLVGALLCEPTDPASSAGVIFFNNVGLLGMCGHGAIGLIVTLAHLGRIGIGRHQIETPVGLVNATFHGAGRVSVENIPSHRHQASVSLNVPGFGTVTGDIAWGGNWFFLVENSPFNLTLANKDALTRFTWAIRQSLSDSGVTGANGQEIDHIELFSHSNDPDTDSRNFVLCPGKAYDRSPCGTGTSAKLACLAVDGKLPPGQVWRQQGILGTVFDGSYRIENGAIVPTITGSAFITGEGRLILDQFDPFRNGIPA